MVQVSNGAGVTPSHPLLTGFGVRPSAPWKDREAMVPQRRDVVVLLAAGPTSGTAAPRHPGTVSQAMETAGYVYYTAIPRFCAVTTSTGTSPAVVGLGSTVWAPGAVLRPPTAPGGETVPQNSANGFAPVESDGVSPCTKIKDISDGGSEDLSASKSNSPTSAIGVVEGGTA